MRIGLIGCVASKLDHPAPARELYTSPLFRGRRAAVEASCDRWFILSALHGLVGPDELLEPYDLALTDLPSSERRAWSRRLLEQLTAALGPLEPHGFEVHAGSAYTDNGLVTVLRREGAVVELPVAGLRLGEQLAWYRTRAGGSVSERHSAGGRPVAKPRSRGRYEPLRTFLLSSSDDAVTLRFEQLEHVLGRELPPSARRHTAWWGNGAHPHSRSWLDAGFEVDAKDLTAGWVRFRRRR